MHRSKRPSTSASRFRRALTIGIIGAQVEMTKPGRKKATRAALISLLPTEIFCKVFSGLLICIVKNSFRYISSYESFYGLNVAIIYLKKRDEIRLNPIPLQ